MDGLSAMAKVAPDALSRVNAALVAGPASAVDDVDELYAAGLPEGLPGNLHHVASVARAELLEHRARVTLKKRELEAARKLSSEQQAQRQIRRSGAYDKHAPSSSGDAAASADDGAERCDECEDPDESAPLATRIKKPETGEMVHKSAALAFLQRQALDATPGAGRGRYARSTHQPVVR